MCCPNQRELRSAFSLLLSLLFGAEGTHVGILQSSLDSEARLSRKVVARDLGTVADEGRGGEEFPIRQTGRSEEEARGKR